MKKGALIDEKKAPLLMEKRRALIDGKKACLD